MTLVRDGNVQIIAKDIHGKYHFNGDFKNANDLRTALNGLSKPGYKQLIENDKEHVLQVFEEIFNHKEEQEDIEQKEEDADSEKETPEPDKDTEIEDGQPDTEESKKEPEQKEKKELPDFVKRDLLLQHALDMLKMYNIISTTLAEK